MRTSMNPIKAGTRRHFLNDCWTGCGAMALGSLLGPSLVPLSLLAERADPMAPKQPHFPAKAKRVIFLNMSGGPSQLDMFDHKPKLNEMHGQPIPPSIAGDQRYAFIKPNAPLRGSERAFKRYRQSGAELSDLLPHLAKVVDDICIVKSTVTDLFNHAPAELFLNSGSGRPGRPSMGSWITWGLGSEASDLPGFVVLHSHSRGWNPGIQGGAACWSNYWLFNPARIKAWCCAIRAIPFSFSQTRKASTLKRSIVTSQPSMS